MNLSVRLLLLDRELGEFRLGQGSTGKVARTAFTVCVADDISGCQMRETYGLFAPSAAYFALTSSSYFLCSSRCKSAKSGVGNPP